MYQRRRGEVKMSETITRLFKQGWCGYHGLVKYQPHIFVLSGLNGRSFEVHTGLGSNAESYFLFDFDSRLRLSDLFDSDPKTGKDTPLTPFSEHFRLQLRL